MFPGLFGHFAAWENLFHVRSLFRRLVASDRFFPFIDDLAATLLTHAMRFQCELFDRFTRTKNSKLSLKKSVGFLSDLHFSIFRLLEPSMCKSGFEKAVDRLIGLALAERESFYQKLINRDSYIEYPKVAFFYAMRSDRTYPLLHSAADAALLPIVCEPRAPPSFENFMDDMFSVQFRFVNPGEDPYTPPNFPLQAAPSGKAMGDSVAGPEYHADGELSEYGVSMAMGRLAADRAAQAELARRTLAVDLVLRDIERALDVLERGPGQWAWPPLRPEDLQVAKDDGSVGCAIVAGAVEANKEWLMRDVVVGLGRVGRELRAVDEAIEIDVRDYFPTVLVELFTFVVERVREMGGGIGTRTAAGLAALAEWLCPRAVDVFTIAESRM
jgi:hypothetical protein